MFIVTNVLVAEAIIVGIGLVGYYVFGSTMVGSLPGGKFDENLKGIDAFMAFAIGFLGTFVIHHASRLITKVPVVSNVLDWYGQHSSYVYLLHPIFLSFIHYVMFAGTVVVGDFQPYAYSFITIGMLVVLFIGVDYLIYKIKQRKAIVEA